MASRQTVLMLLLLLLMLLLLPLAFNGVGAQRSVQYKVGVTSNATLQYLLSNPTISSGNFTGASVRFNFSLLELNTTLRSPRGAPQLYYTLTNLGVQAVVADYFISMAVATYSMGIPYFVSGIEEFSQMEYRRNLFRYEINYWQLNETLFDVSTSMNKNGFVIISDDTSTSDYFLGNLDGKPFIQKVLTRNATDAEIYDVLIRNSRLLQDRSWVLVFSPENLYMVERIFNQSGLAGALKESDVYFIPNLVDIQPYVRNIRQSKAVVYTFSLEKMQRLDDVQLEQLFLTDCFQHFAQSVWNFETDRRVNVTLFDVMYNMSITGESGFFAYRNGRRHNVKLSVIALDNTLPETNFFQRVGIWTEGAPEPYSRNFNVHTTISGAAIRFAAVIDPPYVYRDGFGQLTGLSIEMIELMQANLKFKSEIVFVDDGLYGSLLSNNSWTGIMKYLTQDRADMSANFLTATTERLRFVDSTVNLQESGVQILMKRVFHELDFFHVLYPFSWFVWVSILFSMIVLTATLWLSDKISPNVEGKSIFTIMESFFLVFSSFLMSKVETEPRKPSARLFTLLLWFSTLFYMTTYVSNLVAFLVKPDDSVPFTGIPQLINATGYRYLMLEGAAAYSMAQRKWPRLIQRAQANWPDEFLQSTLQEGIQKVIDSDRYVFIGSASILEYQKTKSCNLRLHGSMEEVLAETFLMNRNFKYKTEVREFLNSIRYSEFETLRRKYFSLNRCFTSTPNPNDKQPLDFRYLVGIFALVGIGAVLGFMYIALHWVYKRVYGVVSRSRGKRLKYGNVYQAEVIKVVKEGVWIGIQGRPQFYFIFNNSLHSDPTKIKNAKSLKLRPGETMQVQYFGKDEATKNRIFARLLEDNTWYQEQINHKDESDSD